jgi:uncharacterized metal-binding protein YceD (DUF177 family)
MVLLYNSLREADEFTYQPILTSYLREKDEVTRIENCQVQVSYTKTTILTLVLHIICDTILACAVTNKEVRCSLDFIVDITYGTTPDCDFIPPTQIDLDQLVYGNIICEKPEVVYHASVDLTQLPQPR